MGKTAIILGASGLTGSIILNKLIDDNRYSAIKLIGRTKIEGLPLKVHQFTGDLLDLESFKSDFTADEVYCCIGTTAKKTPNKKLYKAIDYGIPVAAATLAKKQGIETFSVVSSIGANAKSNSFYLKTKGEMERDILALHIKNTYILQPSIIGGNRKENRIGEKIGLALFNIFQPLLIGGLKKYKITNAEDIAQAMINLSNSPSKENIITSTNIKQITKKIKN